MLRISERQAAFMTRILVVDDNDLVRRGIRTLLRQHEGWDVWRSGKRSGGNRKGPRTCS